MNRKVLFVQGGGEGAYAEDKKLADYVIASLSPKFKVIYPRFHGLENIDYSAWRAQIASELSDSGDGIAVIAHSLGASALLKYLSENNEAPRIDRLILVAMPYKCTDGEWGTDEFALDVDFAVRLPDIKKIVLYHSRDDEWVPFTHLSHWSEKLPQAVIHEMDGRGHSFSEVDFVELIEEFEAR